MLDDVGAKQSCCCCSGRGVRSETRSVWDFMYVMAHL